MAELAGQITSDHLTCQICQGIYQHPKALPCLHSFCFICLQDYAFSRTNESTEHFPCPLCRTIVDIPEGGVSAYPDNHLINSLIDTMATSGSVRRPRHHGDFSTSLQVPTKFNAYNAKVIFGKYGENDTDLHSPTGLCFTAYRNGKRLIHIADQFKNRVTSFDISGGIRAQFNSPYNIRGITSDVKDRLYMACADNRSPALALCSNYRGEELQKLGNIFTYELADNLTVSSDGRIIITTVACPTVYILNQTGKLLHKFGKKGKAKDGFLQAKSMTTNLIGDVYITDYLAHTVKVFDKFGRFKFWFGEEGQAPGQLVCPHGIATDHYGNIVVVDSANYRVQRFTRNGKFIDVVLNNLQTHGFPADAKPTDIAVDQDLMVVLYVGNKFAQVRVYAYEAVLPATKVKKFLCA